MLYTSEERARRDSTRWTLVQGVLAPIQFVIFAASALLVFRFMATGNGLGAATVSVVVKTAALYLIMITGSFWEYAVFGRYLFAPAFFWEDVVGIIVVALHTAYVVALVLDLLPPYYLMDLALLAYAGYVTNAAQFVVKLRTARRESSPVPPPTLGELLT